MVTVVTLLAHCEQRSASLTVNPATSTALPPPCANFNNITFLDLARFQCLSLCHQFGNADLTLHIPPLKRHCHAHYATERFPGIRGDLPAGNSLNGDRTGW